MQTSISALKVITTPVTTPHYTTGLGWLGTKQCSTKKKQRNTVHQKCSYVTWYTTYLQISVLFTQVDLVLNKADLVSFSYKCILTDFM